MNPLTLPMHDIPAMIEKLTPRQLQIVELLAQGNSNKQTGYLLSIKQDSVKRHIMDACRRSGVENRTQLIVIYAMWEVMKPVNCLIG